MRKTDHGRLFINGKYHGAVKNTDIYLFRMDGSLEKMWSSNNVDIDHIKISKDGKKITYKESTKNNTQNYMINNEKIVSDNEIINLLKISDNFEQYALVVSKDHKIFSLNINGKIIELSKSQSGFGSREGAKISDDFSTMTYFSKGKLIIISDLDKKEYKKKVYDDLSFRWIRFFNKSAFDSIEHGEHSWADYSENGRHYVVATKGKNIIIDWEKHFTHNYDWISDIQISNDWRHIAYIWWSENEISVIHNDKVVYTFKRNKNYKNESFELKVSDDYNHFVIKKEYKIGQESVYNKYYDGVNISKRNALWKAESYKSYLSHYKRPPKNTTRIHREAWHDMDFTKIWKQSEATFENLESRTILPTEQFVKEVAEIKKRVEKGEKMTDEDSMFILQNHFYDRDKYSSTNFIKDILLSNQKLLFDEHIAKDSRNNWIETVFSLAIMSENDQMIDNMIQLIRKYGKVDDISKLLKKNLSRLNYYNNVFIDVKWVEEMQKNIEAIRQKWNDIYYKLSGEGEMNW